MLASSVERQSQMAEMRLVSGTRLSLPAMEKLWVENETLRGNELE